VVILFIAFFTFFVFLKFRNTKKLGGGAHGAVWETSSDCNPYKRYAIKTATVPRYEKYLIQELGYLTEPSLQDSSLFVHCFGWAEIDGSFGLVLEYYYSDFDKILKKKKSAQHYRGILVDIVKAIVFLHDKELVHRDIKPSNVLITGI
jgi:serine/threonine protein kinase